MGPGPMGAFILIVVVALFVSNPKIRRERTNSKKHYEFLADANHTGTFLQLAALVVRSDGKTTASELRFVEKALKIHFTDEWTKELMRLFTNEYLEDRPSLSRICRFISYNYLTAERIQIIHLLVGVATADGLLSKSELILLQRIAKGCEVPQRALTSILGMFKFQREGKTQRKQRSKSSTGYVRKSSYSLSLAYQILELKETATDKQVKKAYRKLAVIHHPDKVAHLGESFQKSASDKFQKILTAYNKIKASRGFK